MTDRNEALRLAQEVRAVADRLQYTPGGFYGVETVGPLNQAASLLRQQAERIAELERELKATSDKLQDLQSTFDYVKERRAQISHRLWVWAHEELSEPLKTRYFNIVANGTADVMEQPTYAQQYNAQKHRADAAEAERDQLRAEVERLRVNAERYQWLRFEHQRHDPICHLSWKRNGDRSSSEWVNTADLDAAIDQARTTHKDEG